MTIEDRVAKLADAVANLHEDVQTMMHSHRRVRARLRDIESNVDTLTFRVAHLEKKAALIEGRLP